MSPEMQSQIQIIRAKIAAGTATKEEMIASVRMLRQDRMGAAVASEKSRTKKAAAVKVEVDADNLLDSF